MTVLGDKDAQSSKRQVCFYSEGDTLITYQSLGMVGLQFGGVFLFSEHRQELYIENLFVFNVIIKK